MAEPARVVGVAGARSPLGERVVRALRAAPFVERVETLDLSPDVGHTDLVAWLRGARLDTLVHCTLARDRDGGRREPAGADVIGTMRVCAAASDATLGLGSLVLVSSSGVYPVQSYAPLLRRETSGVDATEGSLAGSLVEAEDYARDVAELAPHLCVAILRLAELAGPGVTGPLARVLAGANPPVALGFDPPVQLLHIEDAVRAILFAAEAELAGVYNVASSGVLHWSEATRAAGRRTFRVLPLEPGPLEPVLRSLGIPHIPNGMLGVLRYGCPLDTSKLAAAGFTPKHDQLDCLAALASNPDGSS